jgi:hypothetical protein
MRYLKYIFITLIFLIVNVSCKKEFLNVQDDSVIIRQNYVSDLKTTGEYLNGIYLVFAESFHTSALQIYPDLIGDNIKATTGSTLLSAQYKWAQIAGLASSNLDATWRNGYQIIHSCSFVLEKAEQFREENSPKADSLRAQAYTIRALAHFMLVNLFAQPYNYTTDASHPGIPYVTSSDWTQSATRNTVFEVYAGIINDLNNGISLFNQGTINVLSVNKNAAKALLARLYLYKGDYLSAKNLAVEVGKLVPIMVGTNYPSKLFTQQETEALFQLMPLQPNLNGGYNGTIFQGRYFNAGSSTQFLATKDIADLIRQNSSDKRNSWIKSGGVGKDTIVKYPVNVISGFSPTSNSYFQTLFRSSEMYLTAAEAYAKLNNEDSALFYLNAIRVRANIPSLTSAITGSSLLDSIYMERRKEFAFESLRSFDLLRLKKGINRQDVSNGASPSLPYPSDNIIAPIPLTDVSVGISQNAGY